MSKIKELIEELGIDETFTKPIKKETKFTRVKSVIYPEEDYNFQADLLELPKTKEGFKYLLVVVDLWTDEFDVEPIKTKTSNVVLSAFKKIIKRKHLNLPEASMRTDGGGEFKGDFSKFLFNKSILKKTAMRGRHQQMANVERLNRTLGRLLTGYMNKKEKQLNKVYREWTDILPQVRNKLNKIRKKNPKKYRFTRVKMVKPKYKIGDMVHYKLTPSQAEDSLGNPVSGGFRTGDRRWSKKARKIKQIFGYTGDVPVRYQLSFLPNVSFSETELLKSGEEEEVFIVREIIEDKRGYYKIWWSGFPKKEATWEKKSKMKKDIPDLVKDYEKNKKNKD